MMHPSRRYQAALWLGGVFWLAVTLSLGACGAERAPPAWLVRVHVPAEIRVGTPLIAEGSGLLGLTLQLEGAGGTVQISLSDRPDRGIWPALTSGLDGGWTHGHAAAADLPDGTLLRRACLVPSATGGVARRCVPIDPVPWRSTQLTGGVPTFPGDAVVPLPYGALVSFQGVVVPLPGEGTATLAIEVRRGGAVRSTPVVAVLPWAADGSPGGSLLITPSWLGARLGPAEVRLRLSRKVVGGADTGPWSAWRAVVATLPALPVLSDATIGRGLPVPGASLGQTWPPIWRGGPRLAVPGLALWVTGAWRTSAGVVTATWADAAGRALPIVGLRQPSAALTSPAWQAGDWAPHIGETLTATLRWRVSGPTAASTGGGTDPTTRSVLGPATLTTLRLRPTVQRMELLVSSSSRDGLGRFGLAAVAGVVWRRTAAIVRDHFASWSVDVRLNTDPVAFADGAERVQVAVLDRDPNGVGLLGNDPSAGKDVGNLRLDERLDGKVDLAGRAIGQPPYGGVFVAGFFLLSPTVNPGGGLADPAFDLIFSAFSPVLGGHPVAGAAAAKAAHAVEAIAQLLAGTISHEVGHTLGLAAAAGYHHVGDHPGWRMDAGSLRPFAERANLPGSGGERWGPIDAAYLDLILPKTAH